MGHAESQGPHSVGAAPPRYFIAWLFKTKRPTSELTPRHGCCSTAFTFILRNAEDVGSPPPAPFPPAIRAAWPRQILVVNY